MHIMKKVAMYSAGFVAMAAAIKEDMGTKAQWRERGLEPSVRYIGGIGFYTPAPPPVKAVEQKPESGSPAP